MGKLAFDRMRVSIHKASELEAAYYMLAEAEIPRRLSTIASSTHASAKWDATVRAKKAVLRKHDSTQRTVWREIGPGSPIWGTRAMEYAYDLSVLDMEYEGRAYVRDLNTGDLTVYVVEGTGIELLGEKEPDGFTNE